MQIVKNANGLYAIRRRYLIFGWEYFDLTSHISEYWWTSRYPSLFKLCWGTLEQVEKYNIHNLDF